MIRKALVTVLLAVPLLVLGAATPALAVGCHGASCNGKSPVVMGCAADAVTVTSVVDQDNAAGGTFGRQVVQLRYSRRCNAAWARVIAAAGGTAHVTWSRAFMGGYRTSTQRSLAGPGSVYSKMRSGSAVNACGRTSFNEGAVVMAHCATAG